MSEADEEALERIVERIRAHDSAALVQFIELRRPQLLAFVRRSLSETLARRVEPEDILQEASLSAVQSLDEIDLSQRDPFSWMCHLCERKIIDAHRHHVAAQKRSAAREVGLSAGDSKPAGFFDILAASLTSPSQAFSRDQKELRLLMALEQLPEASREALRLRYVEGLPSREIARRMDRTDGAIRVLLTRSVSRLQGILSQDTHFRRDDGPSPGS